MAQAAKFSRVIARSMAFGLAFSATTAPAWAADRIQGKYRLSVADDFARKRHFDIPEIELDSGRRIRLKAQGASRRKLDRIPPNATIRLSGDLGGDGAFVLPDSEQSVELLAEPTVASATLARQEKVLIVTGGFRDQALGCSNGSIESMAFGAAPGYTMNNSYLESSYGAHGVTGTVVGPFTIDYSVTGSCDFNAWGAALKEKARAAGVNLSAYTRFQFVLPPQGACGFAGVAYIGGSDSWVLACDNLMVYSHELGHNVGLHHAGTTSSTYADGSDFMGNWGSYPVNAPHRLGMGWLPESRMVAGVVGRQEVTALELDPATVGGPQVVRVAKADTGEAYYVSYRTPVGIAAGMSGSFVNRLNVHKAGSTLSSLRGITAIVAALAPGESFSDQANGLTITSVSQSASTATLDIAAECRAGAAQLTLTPAVQYGRPGTALKYALSVRNGDSPICGPTQFDLAAVLPASLQGSVEPARLTLAAGTAGTAVVTVTSSNGSAEGMQAFSVVATGALLAQKGSASASYGIDATAPTVPTGLAVNAGSRSLTISWQASSDQGIVARYRVFRDGVAIGETSSLSLSDSPPAGTYSYSVSAIDGAGNVSAASAAVLGTLGSKSKGGKGGGGGPRASR